MLDPQSDVQKRSGAWPTNAGSAGVDSEVVIREANATAVALLGLPLRRLVGKPLAVFIAPEDRRTFYGMLDDLRLRRGRTHRELSIQPRHGGAYRGSLHAISDSTG